MIEMMLIIITLVFMALDMSGFFDNLDYWKKLRANNPMYVSEHINIWFGHAYGFGIEYDPETNALCILIAVIDIWIFIGDSRYNRRI